MKFLPRLLLIALLLPLVQYAHDPDRAFFTITQNDTATLVQAEFPWTIRKALIAYNPKLEQTDLKADFENAFRDYLEDNFKLINPDGHILKIQTVKEVMVNSGSHGAHYQMSFEKEQVNEVYNSLMFNLNKHQQNYHELKIGETNSKFMTSQSQPARKITAGTMGKAINPWIYIPFVTAIGMLIILFVIRRKQKRPGHP